MRSTARFLFLSFSLIFDYAPTVHAQWSRIQGLDNKYICAILVRDSVMFAGGFQHALFRSLDSGKTWISIAGTITADTILSLSADSTHIFAGTNAGAYRSTDIGDTWNPANTDLRFSINAFLQLDSSLFAATDFGVYRTTDYGSQWISSGLAMKRVLGMAWGLYPESTDSSDNPNTSQWSSSGLPKHGLLGNAAASLRVFAITDLMQGVYVSTDSGTNWLSIGLTNTWCRCIAAVDTALFVGGTDGVFLYGGSGSNWLARSNGLPPSASVSALMVVNGILFASADGGVYRSTDNGGSWVQMNDGVVFQTSISAMALGNAEIVVAADSTAWRRPVDQLVSAERVDKLIIPDGLVLEQTFPNPFNPMTAIRFSIPIESFVSLKVYDLVGREVTSLVSEVLGPGLYNVDWKSEGHPSGIYFSRLFSDGSILTCKMVLTK